MNKFMVFVFVVVAAIYIGNNNIHHPWDKSPELTATTSAKVPAATQPVDDKGSVTETKTAKSQPVNSAAAAGTPPVKTVSSVSAQTQVSFNNNPATPAAGDSKKAKTIWEVNAQWAYDVLIAGGHYYGVDGDKLVLLDGGTEKILARVSDIDTGGLNTNTFRSGHIAYDNGDIYWGGVIYKPDNNTGKGTGMNLIMRYHNGQLSKVLFEAGFKTHDLNDPNISVNAADGDPRLMKYDGNIYYNYVTNNTVPNVTVDGDYLDVVMVGLDPNEYPSDYGAWEKVVRINKHTGEQTFLHFDQGLGMMSHYDSYNDAWLENGMNVLVIPQGNTWLISDGNNRLYTMDLTKPDTKPSSYIKYKNKFTPRYVKVQTNARRDGYLLHPKIYKGQFWYANNAGICTFVNGEITSVYEPHQFPQVAWVKDWAMDDKVVLFADPSSHKFQLVNLPDKL